MKGRELLAWNLRRLRAEQGKSQMRFAKDAKMDRSYLSELENEHRNASVDQLDKLASSLGVTISELFRLPEAGEKKPKKLDSGRPRLKRDSR